jgi:hypothetical protein
MPTTRLIAIYGYKRSGKSTAADYIFHHYNNFAPHSFATPLKQMLCAIGLTPDQLWGDEKEVPLKMLGGKTARDAMTTLGTEWGRRCIDEDLWVRAWKETLPGGNVVTDDLRFPNEYKAIKEVGGVVVRIDRPGIDADTSHESEAHVATLVPDHVLVNDGSIPVFHNKISELFRELFRELRWSA